MNKPTFWPLIFVVALAYGCDSVATNETGSNTGPSESDWLIPREEVFRAQSKDAIPSVDEPKFAPVDQIEYVADDRMVLGVKVEGEVRAYPIQVLDWHEVVNDEINGKHITVTYCPLTITGIVIERFGTEYGVSGLLFRNNLIMYDRRTGSRWSQMQMRSVNGPQSGDNATYLDVIETTWATWKEMYPDSKILTSDTGFDRNYESFAYANNYGTSGGSIYYPIKHPDDRLEKKVRVHGVIGSEVADEKAPAKAYQIRNFGKGINVIHDRFQGDSLVVVGSTELNFAVAYKASPNNSVSLNFKAVQDSLPIVMKDGEGNRWDVFGTAVEGPRKGEQLKAVRSYNGFWFAWADFFPGIEIHDYN